MTSAAARQETEERVQVLVVDDNLDDVAIARMACQSWRAHDLYVARDGDEALAMLQGDGAVRPDVALLDLGLPGMTGVEVLQAIRKSPELRDLPVIVLTGSEREADIRETQRAGANAYIQKPIDVGTFVRTMDVLGKFGLVGGTSIHGRDGTDG